MTSINPTIFWLNSVTGPNYALRRFASTSDILLWQAAKAEEHSSDRHNDEHQETGEQVPHAAGIGPVVWMQIGLDRVVKSDKDDGENGAAEPGEKLVQEFHRAGYVFRRQPVALIGEIDQRHG